MPNLSLSPLPLQGFRERLRSRKLSLRIWKTAAFLPLVAALLATSGCKTPEEPGEVIPPLGTGSVGNRTPSNSNILRPGDSVDLFVLDHDEFSGRYLVRAQGDIILRKVGRVQVGGMSARSAEAAVKKALDSGQLADAKVILEKSQDNKPQMGDTRPDSILVFISGKVLKPGRYEVASVGGRPPTVYQAVLQAGDCVRFAHKRKVHILRQSADGKYLRVPADLTAIEGGEIEDITLLSGDTIVVPEKTFGM